MQNMVLGFLERFRCTIEGPLDCGSAAVFHAVFGPYGDPLRRGYSTFVDSFSLDGGYFTPVEIEVYSCVLN